MRVHGVNDNVRLVQHCDTGGHGSKGVFKLLLIFFPPFEFVCERVTGIATKDMLNGASNLTKTMISQG